MATIPKNILLVEDDRYTLDIVSRTLQKRGYRMIIASDMESGLKIARNGNFACLISDIFMRGMGGIEGIKAFRDQFPTSKILAISAGYSGMSPNDALKAATKIGADAVLAKPFEPDELTECVAELLAKEPASKKSEPAGAV